MRAIFIRSSILSTLPSAGSGAVPALIATGTEFSIMALIGIILLIGIVKKNAIIVIDFALDAERSLGLSSREAIYETCLKRFRPIVVTTMAALLGAVLLAIDFGEGSELRRSLGISIVGGLIVSQILTLQDAGHLRLSRPLPLMGGTALAQSTPGPAFEGRHSQSRRVSHAT